MHLLGILGTINEQIEKIHHRLEASDAHGFACDLVRFLIFRASRSMLGQVFDTVV